MRKLIFLLFVILCASLKAQENVGYRVNYYNTVEFKAPIINQNGDTIDVLGGSSATDTAGLYHSNRGVIDGISAYDTNKWGNALQSESDPVFSVSVAAGISASDTTRWGQSGGTMTADAINDSLKYEKYNSGNDTILLTYSNNYYDTLRILENTTIFIDTTGSKQEADAILYCFTQNGSDVTIESNFDTIITTGLFDNTTNRLNVLILHKGKFDVDVIWRQSKILTIAEGENDNTPPNLYSVSISDKIDTMAVFNAGINENGYIYHFLQTSRTAPDLETLLNNCDSTDATANVTIHDSIHNLIAETYYVIYYAARDDSMNYTDTASIEFTTLEEGYDIVQLTAPTIQNVTPLNCDSMSTAWTDNNTAPNEINFTIQFDTVNTFNSDVLDSIYSSQNAIIDTIPELLDSTNYYVRIRANGNGSDTYNSEWSSVLHDTTFHCQSYYTDMSLTNVSQYFTVTNGNDVTKTSGTGSYNDGAAGTKSFIADCEIIAYIPSWADKRIWFGLDADQTASGTSSIDYAYATTTSQKLYIYEGSATVVYGSGVGESSLVIDGDDIWLKVKRVGTTITYEYSTDGTNFTVQYTSTIESTGTIYMNMLMYDVNSVLNDIQYHE